MKVKIGPYLSWWGPYQIFGLLTKIGFSREMTDRLAEWSPQWFTDICQWIYNKRKRKIKVVIDDYDIWGLDVTLAYIILPAIKKMKEAKAGVPGVMYDHKPDDLNITLEKEEKATRLWNEVLDDIIWSFEQVIADYSGERLSNYETNDGYDWTKRRDYLARVQKGFDLFGKYYTSFWT